MESPLTANNENGNIFLHNKKTNKKHMVIENSLERIRSTSLYTSDSITFYTIVFSSSAQIFQQEIEGWSHITTINEDIIEGYLVNTTEGVGLLITTIGGDILLYYPNNINDPTEWTCVHSHRVLSCDTLKTNFISGSGSDFLIVTHKIPDLVNSKPEDPKIVYKYTLKIFVIRPEEGFILVGKSDLDNPPVNISSNKCNDSDIFRFSIVFQTSILVYEVGLSEYFDELSYVTEIYSDNVKTTRMSWSENGVSFNYLNPKETLICVKKTDSGEWKKLE